MKNAAFLEGMSQQVATTLFYGNTSVNPDRSTGVAFFNGNGAPTQLWVFWLAPLVGAAVAGVAYPLLFGSASEPDRD